MKVSYRVLRDGIAIAWPQSITAAKKVVSHEHERHPTATILVEFRHQWLNAGWIPVDDL